MERKRKYNKLTIIVTKVSNVGHTVADTDSNCHVTCLTATTTFKVWRCQPSHEPHHTYWPYHLCGGSMWAKAIAIYGAFRKASAHLSREASLPLLSLWSACDLQFSKKPSTSRSLKLKPTQLSRPMPKSLIPIICLMATVTFEVRTYCPIFIYHYRSQVTCTELDLQWSTDMRKRSGVNSPRSAKISWTSLTSILPRWISSI